MIIITLFIVGFITLFYGLYKLFTAEQFDFTSLVPLIASFGVIVSAVFATIASWFGATLCD